MSRRNLIWLAAILVFGAIGWIVFGWLAGVIAGIVVLVISEVVERAARRKRIAARGAPTGPT